MPDDIITAEGTPSDDTASLGAFLSDQGVLGSDVPDQEGLSEPPQKAEAPAEAAAPPAEATPAAPAPATPAEAPKEPVAAPASTEGLSGAELAALKFRERHANRTALQEQVAAQAQQIEAQQKAQKWNDSFLAALQQRTAAPAEAKEEPSFLEDPEGRFTQATEAIQTRIQQLEEQNQALQEQNATRVQQEEQARQQQEQRVAELNTMRGDLEDWETDNPGFLTGESPIYNGWLGAVESDLREQNMPPQVIQQAIENRLRDFWSMARLSGQHPAYHLELEAARYGVNADLGNGNQQAAAAVQQPPPVTASPAAQALASAAAAADSGAAGTIADGASQAVAGATPKTVQEMVDAEVDPVKYAASLVANSGNLDEVFEHMTSLGAGNAGAIVG